MKVHRSVKTRILAHGREGDGKRYWPKIRCVIEGKVRRLTEAEWSAPEPEHFKWVD